MAYTSRSHLNAANEVISEFSRDCYSKFLGWHVLSNEHCVVNDDGLLFDIIGIENRSFFHCKNGKTMADRRIERAVRCLRVNDRAAGSNFLETHQLNDTTCPNLFHWIDLRVSCFSYRSQLCHLKIFVHCDQKYNIGKYKIDNGTRLYVPQGAGSWGAPMWLGGQCEVLPLRTRSSKMRSM